MAGNCSPLKFAGLVNNSVYFKDEDEEYCEDAFTYSAETFCHLCYCPEHKYLILNSAEQLEIRNLTMEELLHPDSKFNIKIYNESSRKPRTGRSVILYAQSNGKKMAICCSENNEIKLMEMTPPKYIKADTHQAVFYMTKLSSSYIYTFESSVHQNRFLAFERENDMLKLVLREKKDAVDMHTEIMMPPVKI
ncbi:unnamed protein product [Ophioblennius macclurei]